MSQPWSWWKRQYLFLDHLLGSLFNFPGNVRAPSSLIYIRTWSIRAFNGVKLVNLPLGGLRRLSSLLSLVLGFFCPWSWHASSSRSLFLGFSSLASSASFAFMYLVALYSTFDMVFKSFLYKENKNLPFRKPFVKATTNILLSASSIESASLLKQVM